VAAVSPFEYAVLRAVPQVQRGECVNVGVVLYCQERDFLDALTFVDEWRLRALDADMDLGALEDALAAVCRTCEGEGPAASTSLGQRFRWLAAPRSTVLQTGPVHAGLTDDPAAELVRLVDALVR
jgi:hypothetical protein